MPPLESVASRFSRVEAAFDHDGFSVTQHADLLAPDARLGYRLKDDCIGVLAEHRSARNRKTGRPKRAYYLEGDAWHRGYLLGLLAEQEISRMTGEFLKKVVFAFFDGGAARARGIMEELQKLIVDIASTASRAALPDIPREYILEIQGIVDGCAAANPRTSVTRDDLVTLNVGVDAVLAHVYSGKLFAERRISPRMLRTPIGCNAFSLSGAAAGGRHFFGRDFMFPTADVFQDTACLVVCNPWSTRVRCLSFVSQTAPGFIGSMAAMNSAGVAMGVNMLASRLCDPRRPGFNSLGLVRDCAQHCSTADEAVERIAAAPRGVTWLYPVADSGGRAFVVEAGRRLGARERFPLFDCVPWHYRPMLPGAAYFRRMRRRYGTPKPRAGLCARANTYRFPRDFILDWNERLWRGFDRDWLIKTVDFLADLVGLVTGLFSRKPGSLWTTFKTEIEALHSGAVYSEADFSERGYIDRTWHEKNCPGPFYFAPQRESRPDVLVATNHAICPEMRLTAMNEWIALLSGGNTDDIQWRYDELNREILDALESAPGGVSEAVAWDTINFLRPDGRFPGYYNPLGALPWEEVQVHGSITLCELTGRSMKSLFGYYGDQPVTITLGHYVG